LEPKESASAESSFERCIGTATRARIPSIVLVRARKFREKVFPGIEFKDSPRSENDILVALSDPAVRTKMEVLGLRYVLVLQVRTQDWSGRLGLAGGEVGIGIGREWDRTSEFKAIVVDIPEARKVGNVVAGEGQLKGGGAFFFLLIIPIPYYIISNVESETCRHFGLALADFLNGKDFFSHSQR